MKEVKITLYEVLGYLMPGLLCICAALLIYWTAFMTKPFEVEALDARFWIALIFVSYLAGHLAQALANIVVAKFSTVSLVFRADSPHSLPPEILNEAKKLAQSLVAADFQKDLPPESVFALCDSYVQQKGTHEDREIYVNREGFYRGMFIACALLSVGLLFRLCCGQSVVQLESSIASFGRKEVFSLSVVCGIASWLFYRRFRRFGKYLVAHGIYNALVIRSSATPSDAT